MCNFLSTWKKTPKHLFVTLLIFITINNILFIFFICLNIHVSSNPSKCLPLNAQCQHYAIMALKSLLALICGACVPNLCGAQKYRQFIQMKRDAHKPKRQKADGRLNYLDGLIWRPTKEKITSRIDTQTPHRTLVAHKSTLAFEDLLGVVGCKTFHTVRQWKIPLSSQSLEYKWGRTLTAQYTHIEPGIDVRQFILQKEGWVRRLLILNHHSCTS